MKEYQIQKAFPVLKHFKKIVKYMYLNSIQCEASKPENSYLTPNSKTGGGGKSNILKNKYINFQCNFLTMSEKSGGTSSLKNLIFYKRIVNKILPPPPRAPCCYRPGAKK